ncbi:CRE-BUS-18 protein [Dirofilaria immitis]|nr:CRE-BUS-18 protein [Dirofilaria immitis]
MELLRYIFRPLLGIIFGIILLSTSFLGNLIITLVLPILYFNHYQWRKLIDRSISFWIIAVVAYLEYIFGIKIKVTGDMINYDQPAIFIMNHRTRLDWMYFWAALFKINPWLLVSSKIALKAELRYVPAADNYIECIYDVTIAYPINIVQSEISLFLTGRTPQNVVFHIKRIDQSSIPVKDHDIAQWINQLWIAKDGKLDSFYSQQPSGINFPNDTNKFIWKDDNPLHQIVKLFTLSFGYHKYGGIQRMVYVKWWHYMEAQQLTGDNFKSKFEQAYS